MKLAAVFQANAVLQRDQEIPVWGWAEAGSRVTGELAGVKAEALCDVNGRFMLRLPALPATSDPLTLTVCNVTTGETVAVNPVYVGEVFLCSGQSNIAFKLKDEDHLAELREAGELDNESIHYFKVPIRIMVNPPEDVAENAHWEIATTETAPEFSAVAFLFQRQFVRDFPQLKVGMIEATYGGTGIESWMSREALDANPFWHDRLAVYHDPKRQDKGEMERLHELFPSLPVYDETTRDWHRLECQDENWETMVLPDSWTESGRNYAGIMWFRHDFQLADVPPQGVTLHLGMIDKGDVTYVNGVQVGKMGNGIDWQDVLSNRVYPVPASCLRPGRNVIAVRAMSVVSIQADGGLIGPDTEMYVEVGDSRIPLTGSWRLKEEANFGTVGADCFAYCGAGSAHSLHILYDNMLAPVVPYGLRGILWYQGGCNAINQAHEYYECLKSWYTDWKARWNQKRLDFILVQGTGIYRRDFYQPYSTRALLREEQQRFCREFQVPMVAAVDTGVEYDSHPTNKLTVALRAEAIAKALILGERVPEPALALQAKRMPDGTIQVTFDCHGERLNPEIGTTQCVLKTEDGSWRAADMTVISENAIQIKTDGKPCCQVIYNWSNFPLGTLRTGDGLPVQPFRRRVE